MLRSTYKKAGATACTLVLALSLAACGGGASETATTEQATDEATTEVAADADAAAVEAMSYADYVAAAVDDPVTIECYVQATQSWWENKATIYAADADGAYFIYNAECTEEDFAKLTEGTKIIVEGYKAEWSGEIEVAEGATLTIVEDGDTFVAEATDVTDLLDSDELINYQNQKVAFKGLTVAAVDGPDGSEAAFTYGADGSGESGDDLYFLLDDGSDVHQFTVESYLCGPETDVYQAVEALNVGDVVDVEGFLYWYEGANPHVYSVTVQ